MTEQQQYKALMMRIGMTPRELSKELGMAYQSVLNQTAPGKKESKKLARWAKAMLITAERIDSRDNN